ncbi:unnamed protein product [Soboliphyme baturini]|uniref:PCI domain-containing protein n=1 Tax=Soboliphyme baturini TaxID=241478 RepID=A0A183IL32_9BILA|nr:unnamed protein product [Soboliphyme baturini]
MSSEPVLSEIGDGRLVKMEVDCSGQVDAAIPKAEALAKSGKLTEALAELFALEKLTRQSADMRSNCRIQVCIVQLCFQAQNWEALKENIIGLTKKRSLIKQAVTNMIQECCTYVDQMPNETLKIDLINTLRTVTAGKIYVEVERARLTNKLAKTLEAEGKIEEACNLLLELQIESYGSMDKQEKVEFLLEQMRLSLLRSDFVRAQLIAKKISKKFFTDESVEIQKLKLKYYHQMIQIDQHEGNNLAICHHYMAVCNTELVKSDSSKLEETLKNIVLYIILSPHGNEQWDLLNRIVQDKQLELIPNYKLLLKYFVRQELISWRHDIIINFESLLRQGTHTSPPTGVFDPETEFGKKQWEEFQTRVCEHNIRMISKYYKRITLKRLSELLDRAPERSEEFLCNLIVNGTIVNAKIDRPAGIVNFKPHQSPADVLQEWSSDMSSLMDKLNKACHLIRKEEMVHKHLYSSELGNVVDAISS